jgi:hypothetical protein
MSFSMRLGVPGGAPSALGGWVSSSYIWTATAEKQPGRLPKAARHRNRFGRQRFLDGTQAPGGYAAPSAR